jgi:Baseplate J-like protein
VSDNRPGLRHLSYRLGTYETFRQRILARIPSATVTDRDGTILPAPGLRALLTRRDDDYAITVVDLWAAVADILSFYQERYANESFVRTAQQADSLVGLASLVDPQAGTAAATAGMAALAQLLLTVAPGAVVAIPAGLRVQSVGGAGRQPQVFETLAPSSADWRLNRLRISPGTVPADPFAAGSVTAALDPEAGPALSAQLRAGASVVLFDSAGTVEEKSVDAVTVAEDRVTVRWKTPIGQAGHSQVYEFRRTFKLFGWNAPPTAAATGSGAQPAGTVDYAYPLPISSEAEGDSGKQHRFCLDGRYRGLLPGQWILVADFAGTKSPYQVDQVDETHDSFGPLTGTVTRVWGTPVGATPSGAIQDRRQVVVYELVGTEIAFAGSEPAAAWTDTVYLSGRRVSGRANAIEVGRTIAGGEFQPGVVITTDDLPAGRQLVLSDGRGAAELVRVGGEPVIITSGGGSGSLLAIALDAVPRLDPATAVASGNLVVASHGQTVRDEVLGSSAGSVPFQTFTLKRLPLTFVPSAQGGGTRGTLHVFVDGVEWREVPALAGEGPEATVFATVAGTGGTVTVKFGDGVNGKIPPAGRSNVTASYRVGSGVAGNVPASTLTSLLDRPPGLLTVTNPFPAVGGVDGGSADVVRTGIGAAVRTMGRAVTARDLEDVVTAAGEVGRARADLLAGGAGRTLVVTAAGQSGARLGPVDLDRIAVLVRSAYDPTLAVQVAPHERAPIVVSARVTVSEDRLVSEVLDAARRAVLAAFSFDALALGEPLHPSRVHVALGAVPGITGVELVAFARKGGEGAPGSQPQIVLEPGRLSAGRLVGAELATIEDPTHDLTLVALGGRSGER